MALDRLNEFLNDPEVLAHPENHAELVREVKLECLLSTENSPYLEVRANVDPTDDPTMHSLTFRVWVIGTVFSACGVFIDVLFGYRNPGVYVGTNVGQLVACELIRVSESLPTLVFFPSVLGVEISSPSMTAR